LASAAQARQPAATSLAVWEVPATIVAGERFTVKIGAKSSAGCDLRGHSVEVRNAAGDVMGEGDLGERVLLVGLALDPVLAADDLDVVRRRLEHVGYLATDPLVRRFCGLQVLPTARTVSRWLTQFTMTTVERFQRLNAAVVAQWTEWLRALDAARVVTYFFVYDDDACVWGCDPKRDHSVPAEEDRFLDQLVEAPVHVADDVERTMLVPTVVP